MEIVPARSPGTELEPVQAPPRLRFQPGELPSSRNPYTVYVEKQRNAGTRRAMKGCLDRMAEIISPTREPHLSPEHSGETIKWWLLGYEDAEILCRAFTEHGYSPSSINKHLSAFRQVLKTSWRLKLMTSEDYAAAADIESVENDRLPAGRSVGPAEVAKMLAACLSEGVKGVRDAAIIAVLTSTGARRDEVASMRIEHFDTVERTIKIIGKRDKEREVYVHDDAMVYLQNWLAILDATRGPMWRSINRWGQIGEGQMTGVDMGRITERWRKAAGVRPMTTHDMRRTFAGNLLDKGVDLATVQELMGHASPVTTQRYDRRPARGRRAAVDKLHLPRPEDLVQDAERTAIEAPEQEGNES